MFFATHINIFIFDFFNLYNYKSFLIYKTFCYHFLHTSLFLQPQRHKITPGNAGSLAGDPFIIRIHSWIITKQVILWCCGRSAFVLLEIYCFGK